MIKKYCISIQLLLFVAVLSGCQLLVLNRKNRYPDPTRAQRETYVQNHPEIPADFRESILKGSIKPGMTKGQVKASLGLPDETKRANHKEYDELWLYYPNWNWVYRLYFKKDILVIIRAGTAEERL